MTNELAYLGLDGENLVCLIEGEEKLRIPFENVENVVCFNYIGCSPALMGKCVQNCTPINFVSPQGRFLAKVYGETKGNVFLRVAQIDRFPESGLPIAQNTVAAKLGNTIQMIKRTLHDTPELKKDADIQKVLSALSEGIQQVFGAQSLESVLGVEGHCAPSYFSIFQKLITNQKV